MKVVFTAGYWDPLHRGHVKHFEEAKKLGDKLLVLVHRDECCKRKKGYVFMPLQDRLEVLRSLKWVDEIIVCPKNCDGSVKEVLEALKPQIFARGGDRNLSNLPREEIEICAKLGIQIVCGVGGPKVQSSSKLVDQVKK